jgi:methyl-accepting chemotaxis protein
MKLETLGLRGRLIAWISTVLFVSGVALVAIVGMVSSRAILAQSSEEMERVVGKTVDELDLWIGSRERDAANLSNLELFAAACKGKRLADAEQALKRIHQHAQFYENVFLADANGKLFLDSIDHKSVGIDISTIEGFKPNLEHGRQKEIWFSEAMKSPATGRPVVLITAPIVVGDRFAGLLGTPVELADFSDTFLKYQLGKSGYFFMFDGQGAILAHPDRSKLLSENLANYDFGREMLSRGSGTLTYAYGGAPRVAQFQRSHKKGWTVAAAMPVAEFQARARTIQFTLGALGLVMLLATFGATWLIAGKASRSIAQMAAEMRSGTAQFTSAAAQIAANSQSLAQGTTEQAASLEDASASAQRVASVTQNNKGRTDALASTMKEAGTSFQVMNSSMDELVGCMDGIHGSSRKISKIIKTVDDIAFQTNLLALNAAVEAARAGNAGMGFAVVADEVRRLAQRSAEAAKDTASLIEEAIAGAAKGQETVSKCAEAMGANSALSKQVMQLTEDLAGATAEQVRGVEMIAQAVSQVKQVTQTTAASAEESASASQEIAAQALTFHALVTDLDTLIRGGAKTARQ